RAHEVCGTAKNTFAFMLAAQIPNTVIYVRENHRSNILNPSGFANIFDPRRILMVYAKTQIDVLAVAEETLRSTAVQMVIYELTKPISLTAARRLQLAAQAGQTLGLGLIQDGMGSNVAETRWHAAAIFDPDDSTLQRWDIIKNKSGTLGSWYVRWNSTAHCVDLVSPTGNGSGS
ncbi:ImuA family protein, partial [Paramylibacter ulvae]|uniref:ImuA family protein n=1 Tax=Paramylibacter ulvae TaxID=1651968 RepID=UPI0016790486